VPGDKAVPQVTLKISGRGSDVAEFDISLNGVQIAPESVRVELQREKRVLAKIVLDIDTVEIDADALLALETILRTQHSQHRRKK
jgi:hypothetical protein